VELGMSETKTVYESPTGEEQAAAQAVRNARELFELLRAPHPAMRVTALKAIQAQPAVALSFGVSQGLDVIDVLISESKRAAGTLEWVEWLGTVDCFDDARVTNFFFDLLANEEEPLALFAAARHLEHVNWATIPKGIEALLLADGNPMRARAASSVVKNAPGLSIRAGVRLGLLSAGEPPVSLLDAEASAAWLAELNGCFSAEAMAALQTQGQQAWAHLALLWDNLRTPVRIWLLRWGSRDFPAMVPGLLPQALRQDDHSLVLEALRTIGDVGETLVPACVRSLAARFLSDAEAEIREAAVRAAPPEVDWRALLASEVNTAVRVATTIQLTKTAREEAISTLIALLDSDNWQERANAAACLTSLGQSVVEAVKPLAHRASHNVRAAALRVLLDLEQDEWLCQQPSL
jgi:hypothetical protein